MGRQSLDFRTQAHRWILSAYKRLSAIPLGNVMLETHIAALVSRDKQCPQDRNRDKVLYLADMSPRPIRDGPKRYRPGRHQLLKVDDRKAA